MVNFGAPFFVILYKNFILRKRHWVLTIFEVVIPIIFFLLIAFTRSKIPTFSKVYVNETTYIDVIPDETIYTRLNIHGMQLLYAPKTSFTSNLIRKTQLKLSLYNEGINGFVDEIELLKYYKKHGANGTCAVVLFDNVGNATPKTLKYNLKMYEKHVIWNTKQLFSRFETYIPGIGSENYLDKAFIPIQLAIDTSFIEIASGKPFPAAINFQEFPYPPHVQDNGINNIFLHVLPIFTVFGFVLLCPSILKRVVEEKSSGIKELMKMYGAKSTIMWLCWFINGFAICLISVIGIVFLLKTKLWGVEYAPIEHCHVMVLTLFLLLYCSASINMLFLFSTMFFKPTLAMVVGICFWIISFIIFSSVANNVDFIPYFIKVALMILPNVSLFYGYSAISIFELREMKLGFSNICESPSASSEDITMGLVLFMLFFETIMFFILAVYLNNIFPGPFGIAKPWYYPLRLFTRGKNKVTESNPKYSEKSRDKEPLVEKSDLPKKIKIQNLTKTYGNKLAVNRINLEINEHQITGLLGHNGAGKTTTMFMLTGMINPTSGNIYVDEYNLQENFDDLCQQIAFCPQHNLLFPDLTVAEHLTIFGMLKGLSLKDAQRETNKLLDEKLNLFDKRNEFINKLSGGMKRKVSLGIALMGESPVIILDEPTAGIDVEGRRGLWDLILSYKNSKTILISTHFMEEADVLSDRIAIMNDGRLLSYATPLYLKKLYDIGYHLSIEYNTDKEGIENIEKRLPEGCVRKLQNQSSYKYILPNNKKNQFSSLFDRLNAEKDRNSIKCFNIVNTTLEDVYLRVISRSDSSKEGNVNSEQLAIQNKENVSNDPIIGILENQLQSTKKPTGINLLWTLTDKRRLYFRRKWISYTIMPAIMLLVTILVVSLCGDFILETTKDGKTLPLNLHVYGETGVYYSVNDNNTKLNNYISEIVKAQGSKPYSVDDVLETITKKGTENIAYYEKRMVAAAEFEMTDGEISSAKALYSNNALHGAPISLNVVMNAIAKMILGNEYSVATSNTPLHSVNKNVEHLEQSSATSVFLWLTLFPLGPLFIMANVILFTYTENATKIKLLQKICGAGCSRLYVNYAVDFLYCIICMVVCALVLCFPPFSSVYEVGTLIIILLIYSLTSIPVAYVFSYSKTVENAYTRFLLGNMCIIPILTLIVLVMELSTEEYYQEMSKVLRNLFAISPQFTLNCMVAKYSSKMVFNYNWNIKSELAKKSICAYDPNPCCDGIDSCNDYQSFFKSTELSFVFVTFATAIVIMVMLSLNEYDRIKQTIFSGITSIGKPVEKAQSKNQIELETQVDQGHGTVLDVLRLKKQYYTMPWIKSKEVVKGITFKVNKSECFGILGINGAGKSTTFRMLAQQDCYSGGEIKRHSGEFMEHYMGYCPQQDALIEEFTGRELLGIFAKLRGLLNPDEEVKKMLTLFDLNKYADVCCGMYSGGNKRKLNTCLSMIGLPLLILLDEPTTGVDPVSRRKLWDMIANIKKEASSGIVLTSHSMDECEATCDRLMIMKDGGIVHKGTIKELREKQRSGFTVKLKLTKGNEVGNIKADLYKNLKDVVIIEDHVKEEHGGLIQLQAKEDNWSEVFDKMEKIISKYESIEDYTVNEASLEDLFLKIARDKHVNSEIV